MISISEATEVFIRRERLATNDRTIIAKAKDVFFSKFFERADDFDGVKESRIATIKSLACFFCFVSTQVGFEECLFLSRLLGVFLVQGPLR